MLKNERESFSVSESLHQKIREHSWRIRKHSSARRTPKGKGFQFLTTTPGHHASGSELAEGFLHPTTETAEAWRSSAAQSGLDIEPARLVIA
jgi:hypothetical protein